MTMMDVSKLLITTVYIYHLLPEYSHCVCISYMYFFSVKLSIFHIYFFSDSFIFIELCFLMFWGHGNFPVLGIKYFLIIFFWNFIVVPFFPFFSVRKKTVFSKWQQRMQLEFVAFC